MLTWCDGGYNYPSFSFARKTRAARRVWHYTVIKYRFDTNTERPTLPDEHTYFTIRCAVPYDATHITSLG